MPSDARLTASGETHRPHRFVGRGLDQEGRLDHPAVGLEAETGNGCRSAHSVSLDPR